MFGSGSFLFVAGRGSPFYILPHSATYREVVAVCPYACNNCANGIGTVCGVMFGSDCV